MKGLKSVSDRRRDALTRVAWDRLETLLAAWYRSEGYDVEHVGTGATGARFDGGIDLKLRRDDQYILVQCKHWNAMKVPHNAVHELLGVMVNEGATGAILATSGEFTRAAIEAATKLGHVQLIDGDELRVMLGPIRESEAIGVGAVRMRIGGEGGTAIAKRVGERLLSAAEDRIRYGQQSERRHGSRLDLKAILLIKLVGGVLFLLFVAFVYWFTMRTIASMAPSPQQVQRPDTRVEVAPVPASTAQAAAGWQVGQIACHELIDRPSGTYIDHCAQGAQPTVPSAAERRKQQRKAAAAIDVIADSTPEM